MTPADRTPGETADRKAVLFCPACEHDAPFDGDWSRDTRGGVDDGRTDVACPHCGTVVVSQPEFPRGNDGGIAGDPTLTGDQAGAVVQPVLQLVNAVVRHDVL